MPSKSDIKTMLAFTITPGKGGETHQQVATDAGRGDAAVHLATNEGPHVCDNQNQLEPGARGPALQENPVLMLA